MFPSLDLPFHNLNFATVVDAILFNQPTNKPCVRDPLVFELDETVSSGNVRRREQQRAGYHHAAPITHALTYLPYTLLVV